MNEPCRTPTLTSTVSYCLGNQLEYSIIYQKYRSVVIYRSILRAKLCQKLWKCLEIHLSLQDPHLVNSKYRV